MHEKECVIPDYADLARRCASGSWASGCIYVFKLEVASTTLHCHVESPKRRYYTTQRSPLGSCAWIHAARHMFPSLYIVEEAKTYPKVLYLYLVKKSMGSRAIRRPSTARPLDIVSVLCA